MSSSRERLCPRSVLLKPTVRELPGALVKSRFGTSESEVGPGSLNSNKLPGDPGAVGLETSF